ncbi:MAG TPA: PIN domain-containing protein [Ktedonobacterales bacterium]
MGQLALPEHGSIYLDANCIIYSMERIEPYRMALQPLWEKVNTRALTIITSELTLLEVLVGPLKTGNKGLEGDFRVLLQRSPDVSMIAITQGVLERAANLRAMVGLKTPDAIHAATALVAGCALLVTNDPAFRRVAGLPVGLLSEALP